MNAMVRKIFTSLILLAPVVSPAAVLVHNGGNYSYVRFLESDRTEIQEFIDPAVVHSSQYQSGGMNGMGEVGIGPVLNGSNELLQFNPYLLAAGQGRVGQGNTVSSELYFWFEVTDSPVDFTLDLGSDPTALGGDLRSGTFPRIDSNPIFSFSSFGLPSGNKISGTLPVGMYRFYADMHSYDGSDVDNQIYSNNLEFIFHVAGVPEPSRVMFLGIGLVFFSLRRRRVINS